MNLTNLKKLSSKQKMLLTFAIFCISYFLIIFFIILPTIKNIKDQRDVIISQKIELGKKILQDKNMTVLSEKLKSVNPKINIIEQAYINKNRELEFITILEGLASKNNITQTINLETDNINAKNYSKIPLKMNLQGKFNDLLNYIIGLETLGYYININNLQFSLNNDIYSLTITSDSYWK